MRLLVFLCLAAALAAASSPERTARAGAPASGEVRWVGQMRDVMREGDLADRASLETLARTPGLYAVGPLSGLRGEITVIDGVPSIATVEKGSVRTHGGFNHRAPFLVYAHVDGWREISLARPVNGLPSLEALVLEAARAHGVDVARPFPFLVRGVPTALRYHVLNRQGDAPFSREQHDAIKVAFEAAGTEVTLVGFYSEEHQGVFTHHGSFAHVHMRTADGKASGHVDEVRLPAGAVLSVPRHPQGAPRAFANRARPLRTPAPEASERDGPVESL